MINPKTKLLLLSCIASSLLANDKALLDASLQNLLNTSIQTKAQVGSRDNAKDYLQSNAPVDVITLEQINASGVTKLTDLLSYYIAGFTTRTTSLHDETDHIVNYTLRGMNADQILILVNSKRYHPSSIVSTVSGINFVDLNSIPLVAVNRVEVLRDGAAAQYGSDAIAGVINIILKSNDANSVSLHSGMRKEGDGAFTQADAFVAIPLDYDGFVNFSLTANHQEATNRAGVDSRSGTSPALVREHFGIPDAKTIGAVFNSEVILQNSDILYSNFILNYKESEASTFYRFPKTYNGNKYNGFLPLLKDRLLDSSLTLGAKGQFQDGTSWDISNIYGYNSSDLSLTNTMNYDLNSSSPTSFHNGKLATLQNTTNLDLKKSLQNILLSGGLEYRYENYSIKSGESASYFQTGSQGFPGYEPSNEVDNSRESYAVYLDTLYNFTPNFSTDLALRHEHFSDFGKTTNYKLAVKYKVTPKVLLRATTSTGFRAPSLSQSSYSYTSSSLTNGKLSKKGIYQPEHPLSKVLGAKPLDAENSTHYSAGVVYKPTKNSFLTLDSFLVRVNNRILLSEKQKATTPAQQAMFDTYSVTSVQYFKNIADLKTYGVDIKYSNNYTFQNSHELDTTLWFNYSQTRVANRDALSQREIHDLENLSPKQYAKLLNVYKMSHTTLGCNINYYGSHYESFGGYTKFDAVVTTDFNIAYAYTKKLDFAIGGFNIFDKVPNKWTKSNSYIGYDGIMPYALRSPIGFSGAYYYLSLRYKF